MSDLPQHTGMSMTYQCGPSEFVVSAASPDLYRRAAAELALYARPWGQPYQATKIDICVGEAISLAAAGNYLRFKDMDVDARPGGLRATCRSGAQGEYSSERRTWTLVVPPDVLPPLGGVGAPVDDNLSDLLELALTTAWRAEGWVPIHAGCVTRGDRCILITAPSRGGKTTLTSGLLHRGWATLGDDKTLAGLAGAGRAEVRSVQTHFNIDPQAVRWFPEIGDLSGLPLDSAWTPKRRVPVEDIWGDCVRASATPTHLVRLSRGGALRSTAVEPIPHAEILPVLLRQTVIPNEPAAARRILTTLAAIAGNIKGLHLRMAEDAYSDPAALDMVERGLT